MPRGADISKPKLEPDAFIDKPRAVDRAFPRTLAGLRFRPMNSGDLAAILEIERASFTFPWSASFFVQELKVTCARSHLAFMDGRTVGYVIYWLLPREIDIHNI